MANDGSVADLQDPAAVNPDEWRWDGRSLSDGPRHRKKPDDNGSGSSPRRVGTSAWAIEPLAPNSPEFDASVQIVAMGRVPSYIGLINDAAARTQARRAAFAYAAASSPDAIQHVATSSPHVFPSVVAPKAAVRAANSPATQRAMARARVKEELRRKKAEETMAALSMRSEWYVPLIEQLQQVRYRYALLPKDHIVTPSYPVRLFRNSWETYKARSVGPWGRIASGGWAPMFHLYTFQTLTQAAIYPWTKQFEYHHADEPIGPLQDYASVTMPWWSVSPLFASVRFGFPYLNDKFPGLHEWVESRLEKLQDFKSRITQRNVVYRLDRSDGGDVLTYGQLRQRMADIAQMPGEPEQQPEQPALGRHPRYADSKKWIDQVIPEEISISWWRAWLKADPFVAARAHAIVQLGKFTRGDRNKLVLITAPGTATALAQALLVLEVTMQHKFGGEHELRLDGLPRNVRQAFATLKDNEFKQAVDDMKERFADSIGLEMRATKEHRGSRNGYRVATAVAGIAVVATGAVGDQVVSEFSTPAGASQVKAVSGPQAVGDSDLRPGVENSKQRIAELRQAQADAKVRAENQQRIKQERAQYQAAVDKAVDLVVPGVSSDSTPQQAAAAQEILQQGMKAAHLLGDRDASYFLGNQVMDVHNRAGGDTTEQARAYRDLGTADLRGEPSKATFTNTPDGLKLELKLY